MAQGGNRFRPMRSERPVMNVPKRHAEWGHWAITLWERSAAQVASGSSYHPGALRATIAFPVGTRGPCDIDGREGYRATIRAWIDNGTLPA